MITQTDTLTISAISLTFCCVPLDIILAVGCGPGWQGNSLQTARRDNTRNHNIKIASFLVLILDADFTLRLTDRNIGLDAACSYQLAIILHIVKMHIIFALDIVMVAQANSFPISAISLTLCVIPLDIILAVGFRPSRQWYALETAWRDNTRNHDIKIASFAVSILNADFALDFWSLNGNSRFSAAHTDQVAVILHIVKVHIVLALNIIVITQTDMLTISAISLTLSVVPFNIILTIHSRPSWQRNALQTARRWNTWNHDIKIASFFVSILNTDGALRFAKRNGRFSAAYTDQAAVILDIVEMNIVLALHMIVIAYAYPLTIGAVGLTFSSIPLDIILAVGLWPSRQRDSLKTTRGWDTWNHNIEITSFAVTILNADFALWLDDRYISCSTANTD